MNFKKTFLFLLAALLCSMTSMAEGIFSTQYGEKWVTIQGVGITTRYAYVDGTTLRHGTISDITNPGDAYLWCFVGDASSCRIYNKSLGEDYQVSQSSSTTSSITLSTSNSGTFTLGTSDSYFGYSIKPTNYTQYWNLYGGSDWSSTQSTAPIGYWNSIDQHSMWTIATTYSLVFSTETATEASAALEDLTDDELAACTGSFSDQATLERYWELCPRKNPVWRSRMGETMEERRQNMAFDNGVLELHASKVTSVSDCTEKFLTSGIQSWSNWQYGIFEIKAKVLGAHTGNFPALWMMPAGMRNGIIAEGEQDWPDCGEIDIMEMIDESYGVWSTVHNTAKNASNSSYTYTNNGGTTVDGEYHTYTLVWKEDALTWYVDGNQIFQYAKDDNYSGDVSEQFPFNKPYFMILNQSCGGNWAANPDEEFDYEMDIEYVRIYQNEDGIMNVNPSPYFHTYTRENVAVNTWQSFCLPMNVNDTELNRWFDKIYIPSDNGNFVWIYDDTCNPEEGDGGIGGDPVEGAAPKRRAAGIETYSDEEGSWTADGEETSDGEVSDDDIRGAFAYCPEGTYDYQLYLADYTNESQYSILMGKPFFARVREDAPLDNGSIALECFFFDDDDLEQSATLSDFDYSYLVFKDNTLTEYYEYDEAVDGSAPMRRAKAEEVSESTATPDLKIIGLLEDNTYSEETLVDPVFYGLNPDGSFFVVSETLPMESYHAYIGATAATSLTWFALQPGDLEALEEIEEYELTVYRGSSTAETLTSSQWPSVRTATPNAIAIISADAAEWAETQTNVVVDYPVGRGHYYECPNLVLTDLKNWGDGGATTAAATDFYSPVDFYAISGSYSRPLVAGYNSACVPFEIANGEFGSQELLAYSSYNENENTVYFTYQNSVDAGVAVIFNLAEAQNWTVAFDNTLIKGTPTTGTSFKGVFVTTNAYKGTYYSVSSTTGKFSYLKNYLYPFRACFRLEGDRTNAETAAPSLVIEDASGTTDIEDTCINEAQNGSIRGIYSIVGQYLGENAETLAPGFYIIDGNKAYIR